MQTERSPPSSVSRLLSPVFCLLFPVSCLLFPVSCSVSKSTPPRIVEIFSVPVIAVEVAKLDGFSEVLGGYFFAVIEIGNRPGDTQYAIVSASR